MNVNADWGSDPLNRPQGPLGVSWWAAAYARPAAAGVQMLYQYDFVDSPEFGLIGDQTGARRPSYWLFDAIQSSFAPGSWLLAHSPLRGVDVLAARRPDGRLALLIATERGNAHARGGAGRVLKLTLASAATGRILIIDRRTLAKPRWRPWRPGQNIRIAGYGAALLILGAAR